ncbi:MAG: hypothetical protein PHF86_07675 [Candidatus Nanoarchaeia archaeon]|jgi:hypothetical protein|nr:hypothetical protein [Candidatus Nanoarchaeia archaeon]
MEKLVIAPTADYRRGPLRKEVEEYTKDSPDAIRIQEKIDSIVPKGADKSKGEPVENRIYQDFRPMRHLHERNRARYLNIYEIDELYAQRPMYNISLPDMKLRKQT